MLINILILLILFQALGVILSRNAINSVLFLIGTYISTAVCFLLLGAEYLALMLAIVYIGAIAILFIFVIMMLNLRILEVYNSRINYIPLGIFIIIWFLVIILYISYKEIGIMGYDSLFINYGTWISDISLHSNMQLIAEVLYNHYPQLVIYTGLFLFFAMLGVIIITVGMGDKVFIQEIRRGDKRLKYWKVKKIKNNNSY